MLQAKRLPAFLFEGGRQLSASVLVFGVQRIQGPLLLQIEGLQRLVIAHGLPAFSC